ncbi:MAG TPA: hypothetical protein VEL76_12855 [Gemmataceae bacterium]|nr:hypothetical protein [Gemmataceae bacterium]
MSLLELMPQLRALPRAEKVRAIQLLAEELAREEPALLLETGKSYPLWSPWNSFDAATVLLRVLEADKEKP